MLVLNEFSSVTESCPILCNPTDRSTPGFPVHHQLPKLAQTHVHWVGDTIQPPHSFHWWRVIHELKSHLVGNNLHIFIHYTIHFWLRSVQFSCSVMSDSLQPHGLQHARPACPSPAPGAYSNSCPLSRWCHPTISSSVIPFSSCPQSFPASGSFPMSQLFASGGQSIGVPASISV